ncbi:sortase (plasmid) [Rubrobacter tropicus]|uniref:Sortase n=1 Tax=Rubrobacter tropicus TaxID=2653851 RepID=A0A6G8QFW4_9ACTN|nr:class E sortase [Rubrobacter tropicus]QIN85360.1 sortase [Rubrobacter tropicus]
MGRRSRTRTFRRRRRRASFALLVTLAVAVLGALAFADPDPGDWQAVASQGARTDDAVPRAETPRLAPGAPDAPRTGEDAGRAAAAKGEAEAAEPPEPSGDDEGDEPKEERKEPERAAGPPPVPDPPTNDLWMSVPKMGLYDDYVANSDSEAAMDRGAIKLTSTGFPWQEGANTYIAAHRIGYPGTESDYQFYDLPNLALGDRIYLGDVNGTTYTYEVTGFKEVLPSETWVTAPKAGRDMISLQTCIEDYGDYWTMGPNWYVRYVVQAERVSVDPA